ncbi:MAG: hypothetical protein K1X36_09585 [Pyrinomonadaceae bacterium]|nr:hypothetical protein [Pyrinomonadaceae bacterium]
MKDLLFIAILTSIFAIAANAQSFPQSWIGTYEGMVSSMNAGETRSMTMWAKIEFGEAEGGRYVVYTEGENSDTQNKYVLTPVANAMTLSFHFENCMPVEYGSSEPCTSEFKKGDLMFQLVKTKSAGKTVIHTVWRKLKKDTPKAFFVKQT